MTRKLLTFALYPEAKATIERLSAVPVIERELYQFDEGFILLTGFGSLRAATLTSRHMITTDDVWNFGIAGALSDTVPLKTLYEINHIIKHDNLPDDADTIVTNVANTAFPSITLDREGETLITSDFPIHSKEQREKLLPMGSIVDMEGYGVALAAELHDKPCRIFKATSDFADEVATKQIKSMIKELSTLLADAVEEQALSPR